MSDLSNRDQGSAAQRVADALLRSVAGTSACLRVTGANAASGACELGLVATPFSEAVVSPVVLRKLRPTFGSGSNARCELLVSASSVAHQVNSLQIDSAQALFSMTLAVTVAGQEYLIESIASNEAFGRVYLYRLLLREARPQAV